MSSAKYISGLMHQCDGRGALCSGGTPERVEWYLVMRGGIRDEQPFDFCPYCGLRLPHVQSPKPYEMPTKPPRNDALIGGG